MRGQIIFVFITALIASIDSFTIRDFASNEFNDVEPDHTKYAAVARYVVHKSGWLHCLK